MRTSSTRPAASTWPPTSPAATSVTVWPLSTPLVSVATGTLLFVPEPLELMPSWPDTFEPQQ